MTSVMTDEEIRDSLLKLGVNIGPVVDSTRDFYRKKLAKLLGEIKDEPVVPDDDGGASENEETTESAEQWRENLFSETYNPRIEIRARRSIHANLESRPGSISSNAFDRTSINRPSNVSTDTSGYGSVATVERTNTKLICLMLGVALLSLVLYVYSPSTEVATKNN